MTYPEAVRKTGSTHQVDQAVRRGELYKVARGVYSTIRRADPYLVVCTRYPDAVITMDSAFYIHGLTGIAPDRIHLATRRNATRIHDGGIKQYFTEDGLFGQGAEDMPREGGHIRIYSPERMLVELVLNSAGMPLDYYKEIIGSYRRRAESLDIHAIEDYIDLFDRGDAMFDVLQKEVL